MAPRIRVSMTPEGEAQYREDINSASDAEWELAWALQNVAFSGDYGARIQSHADKSAPSPLYIRQARAILGSKRNIERFTEILLAAESGSL